MNSGGLSRTDNLLKHSAILFSGMAVVHLFNILFQMAVSRSISKEEYVLLTAFLSLLAMIQRPLGTLRTGVSHYSSILLQEDRAGDIRRLLRKWLLLSGFPSLLIGLIVLVFNERLASFFHLSRTEPVVIMGIILPSLFVLPVLGGAVQGLQKFSWNMACNVVNAVVRLGLGAGFVFFLYPACGWAMLGHGLGLYAGGGVLFIGLIVALWNLPKTREPLPSMRFYLLQSFLIQAAYGVLMTADVVLINHYLPEDTEFAYAATLSRMVVFLPGAIAVAMFPKVSSKGTITGSQKTVFFHSLAYTALFVLVAVLGCALVPGLLARILFGISDASPYLRKMIGLMAVVMGFSALLNIVLQFLIAQRRFATAFPILFFAVMYLAGVAVFNANSWQVAFMAAATNFGALAVVLLVLACSRRRDNAGSPRRSA